MIRVASFPHADDLQPLPTSGISQVVSKYFHYLPRYDIELVEKGSDDADLVAVHAGALENLPGIPLVSHCHGLYFTADTDMGVWPHSVNQTVINVVRHASVVTVPSEWVAQVFRRDMHLNPVVIPHGVDWDEWQDSDDQGYVLWNKNRASDACDPTPVNELAQRAPKTRFLTTYAAPDPRPNIKITGSVPFETMRKMVMGCSVYLATTKETFGIGTLEAMASSKPILGFDYGGTSDLVKHGFSGYLARPGDYDDLARGLEYCVKHQKALGRNAAQAARDYTWDKTARAVAQQYALTLGMENEHPTVAVVIPMYNKAATVLRAIRSAIHQSQFGVPDEIVVVNNNSTDDFGPQIEVAQAEAEAHNIKFTFLNCAAQGVAHARNLGINATDATYICCLDADDEILPDFIKETMWALQGDRSLGIAYTALEAISQDGRSTISGWPSAYNFDLTLKGRNQVPTCCLFRRVAWERAGGYRQRYAPGGAGSEDADLWLRMGLLGWGGIQATTEPLFRYYLGGATSNPDYREKDWRGDKGWLALNEMPFAATSTPPNGRAHLVRQYDEPLVSVIIPVGPGHSATVIDAIDSVEGQTFRKWELIVVDDTDWSKDGVLAEWERLQLAFPFARFVNTLGDMPRGAGFARNRGAELAKAPLLLFLDADDWLTPTALADMVEAYEANPGSVIYTDYIGHAYIQKGTVLDRLRQANRLLDYNEKTTEAKVLYYASDFDCAQAQAQPVVGKDPYVWNVVSSLVPTSLHRQIKGFDEEMASWEDWDYWVRLARAGVCFAHLSKPLLEYRFYTGTRRTLANPYESGESGRQLSAHLLEYMRGKYERTEIMPCGGCGSGRRSSPPPARVSNRTVSEGVMSNVTGGDMVQVELVDGNVGDHLIAFRGTSYGYRSSGDKFPMLREHAQLDRRVRIVEGNKVSSAVRREAAPPPPPPPGGNEGVPAKSVVPPAKVEKIDNDEKAEQLPPPVAPPEFDLTTLWGVDADRADLLLAQGVRTPNGVVLLGAEKIAKLFGMADITARRVVSEAEKFVNELAADEEKTKVKK